MPHLLAACGGSAYWARQIAALGHDVFEDFAFMIDAPEIVGLAVDTNKHLVQVPAPLWDDRLSGLGDIDLHVETGLRRHVHQRVWLIRCARG